LAVVILLHVQESGLVVLVVLVVLLVLVVVLVVLVVLCMHMCVIGRSRRKLICHGGACPGWPIELLLVVLLVLLAIVLIVMLLTVRLITLLVVQVLLLREVFVAANRHRAVGVPAEELRR
jgi:hypothetical protein